jgi:endo-1,4-beta-xylanase
MGAGSNNALQTLAANHGLRIGTCVSTFPLLRDRSYAATLAREFDLITPENALKFETVAKKLGSS